MAVSEQDWRYDSSAAAATPGLRGEAEHAYIAAICIAAARAAPMQYCPNAEAVAGQGLIGDRYERGQGTFSARSPIVAGGRALSLIDTDDIARCHTRLGVTLDACLFRRNLVVAGIDLLACRGARFAIGEAIVRLVGRCAPCGVLSRRTGVDMRRGLYRGGGMRAVIEQGGRIACGDRLYRLD